MPGKERGEEQHRPDHEQHDDHDDPKPVPLTGGHRPLRIQEAAMPDITAADQGECRKERRASESQPSGRAKAIQILTLYS